MPINFIPNDPASSQPPLRQIAAVQDRASTTVRFIAGGLPPQAVYAPGTPDFVAWQCREAAWRTLDVYEEVCGALAGWRGSPGARTLRMVHNGGVDLNAYYDRRSISFFEFPVGGRLVYSGASSDVVAHETGHAILDALRPDLWGVNMVEVAAFHEGFGDCIAILFTLSDKVTRETLLVGTDPLAQANFVEATAEELSDAIRIAAGPNHNAAAPRRANNNFVWALPQTLPVDGPPGTLINESHSLGQLVSGIYYDLIAAIYRAGGTGEAALWAACTSATRIVVEAAVQAPVQPRFIEGWGQMMLIADDTLNNGANAAAIRGALERHGIAVGATPFLTPQAAIAGGRRRRRRAVTAKNLASAAVRARLRGLMQLAPATPFAVRQLEIAGEPVAEVSADLSVDLTGLSEMLAGVVAHVPRPTLLGQVDGTTAVLGRVQSSFLYSNEVRDFVGTLVRRKAIAEDAPRSAVALVRERNKSTRAGRGRPSAGYVARDNVITHVVTQRAGEKVIERVAFACGCHARRG
jgi:hypothetical protein